MILEQVLESLGLSDKEPEVYLALLKTPGVQPASVIAKKVNLNRVTVYKTLMRLAEIGLVTKTMKFGITCFFVEEPDKSLENLFKKKKEKMNALNQELLAVLPQIKNLQQQELLIPRVRFYEGVEGVKRVYEDTLIENKDIYAFENAELMTPEVHDYIFNDYIPRRAKNDLFIQVIAPRNKTHIEAKKHDKTFFRETRFFATDKFPLEIEINIYGHKTAFFSYKKEEMFGAILESRAIANSMKAIFAFCWKFCK